MGDLVFFIGIWKRRFLNGHPLDFHFVIYPAYYTKCFLLFFLFFSTWMEVVVFDQSSIAIAIACIYYISRFLLLIYVSVPYTNHESIIHYKSTPGVVQMSFWVDGSGSRREWEV